MDYLELQSILLNDKPSKELRERKEELKELIPEIEACYDFDQKTIWHPYDVFEHTLQVIDNTKPDVRLRLAALFHDIGKPESMTIDDDEVGHFYGHWVEGEQIFINYQDKFHLDEEDIYLIRKLIFYHDLTIDSASLKRFLEEFDEEGINLLFALKEADIKAQNKEFINDRLNELENTKKAYNLVLGELGVNRINDSIIDLKDNNHSTNRISDTNYTFEELYDERNLILAALCNSSEEFAFKTKDTTDKGNFIAGILTPNGLISYHIDLKYWDYFQVVELERAPVEAENAKEANRDKFIALLNKNKQYKKEMI